MFRIMILINNEMFYPPLNHDFLEPSISGTNVGTQGASYGYGNGDSGDFSPNTAVWTRAITTHAIHN